MQPKLFHSGLLEKVFFLLFGRSGEREFSCFSSLYFTFHYFLFYGSIYLSFFRLIFNVSVSHDLRSIMKEGGREEWGWKFHTFNCKNKNKNKAQIVENTKWIILFKLDFFVCICSRLVFRFLLLKFTFDNSDCFFIRLRLCVEFTNKYNHICPSTISLRYIILLPI